MGGEIKRIKRLWIYIGVAFVVVISLISALEINKNRQENNSKKGEPQLPLFTFKQNNGDILDSRKLLGFNIYIQFVDSRDINDINLLNSVINNWSRSELVVIAVISDIDSFIKHNSGLKKDLIMVTENYAEIKKLLKSHKCCTSFHLYNKNSVLVASGQNLEGYNNGVKIYLDQLIKNKYFEISSFIDSNNIFNIPWLYQFGDYIMNTHMDGYIFSIFTNICDTCLSGSTVREISKFYSAHSDKYGVLSLLGNKYDIDSISNMRNNLKINYDILISSERLKTSMANIISNYNDSILNNIIIFTDSRGNILKVFHNNCDCWKSFSNYINEFPILMNKTGSK